MLPQSLQNRIDSLTANVHQLGVRWEIYSSSNQQPKRIRISDAGFKNQSLMLFVVLELMLTDEHSRLLICHASLTPNPCWRQYSSLRLFCNVINVH